MDDIEQRRARVEAIVERSYDLMDETERLLAAPRAEVTWQPRQAEEAAPQRKQSPSADVVNLRNHVAALEARHKADRAAISSCLNAIAEEAGAATGKLQKQIGELKAQLEAMRGELALARAQANVPTRRPKTDRSPWKLNGDVTAKNN